MEKTLQLLGEKIKFLRKKQNLTQIALSKGICTQPYLSHIEKGQTSPSAYILSKLANRLGVDPTYLLKTEENEKYTQEMMELIREASTKRDYILIEDILKNEQMIFFKNEQLKQFYYWYKGITVFYNKNDLNKSMEYLNYAIDLESNIPFFSKTKLEIMISKANILMDSKLYKEAEEIYKIIYEKLTQHEKTNIEKLYIRTCYNYSRILRLTENYEEALKICRKGIKTCFKFDLMYALGDLYFQKGLILKIKKQNVLAKKSFENSLLVYKLYKNEYLINLTQKRLNELNSI